MQAAHPPKPQPAEATSGEANTDRTAPSQAGPTQVQALDEAPGVLGGTVAHSARRTAPPPLPRSPQRSLLMPAIFLFLVSAPAVYTLSAATHGLSPWVLVTYLFLIWALAIVAAFFGRRGPKSDSKIGWSSRV